MKELEKEYEISVCPYFSDVVCEEKLSAKDIRDICLSTQHREFCDKYIQLRQLEINKKLARDKK